MNRVLLSMSLILSGCGASSDPATKKADVLVTIDGMHSVCVVALAKEAQGSSIACSEVLPFVKDELRVPTGATYDLRTTPPAGDAEAAGLREKLKAAGYRFVGDS